jgi:hypothetical protein
MATESLGEAMSKGGAAQMASCESIKNPWDPINFQIPNPVSTRLSALLPPKQRINASLIYYALGVAVVLDYLVNDEHSWAYPGEDNEKAQILFRSVDNAGVTPTGFTEVNMDVDSIFKESLTKKTK